jgi:outer membrane protein assembly factor BamB
MASMQVSGASQDTAVVKAGTKEWIGYWTLLISTLGMLITVGTLLIKYEHRATMTENAAASAKATADGVNVRLTSIDQKIDESTKSLDAKMVGIDHQIESASKEQGRLGTLIEGVSNRLQRIERNQDQAFNRLRPN